MCVDKCIGIPMGTNFVLYLANLFTQELSFAPFIDSWDFVVSEEVFCLPNGQSYSLSTEGKRLPF
jgi:hypothetical protein